MVKILLTTFSWVVLSLLLTGKLFNVALAEEGRVNIAVMPPTPGGLMSKDGTGAIADLCQSIFQRIPQKVKLEIYPTKRTILMFNDKKAEIYILPLEENNPSFIEVPLGLVSFKVIVTRNDQPIISDIRELEGMNVGIRRGWSYPPELLHNPKIMIDEVESFEQNVKKLKAGRLDAIVLSNVDLSDLKLKFTGIHFDAGKRIFLKRAVFRFHADENGKQLADAFRKALDAIRREGLYGKIFEPYELPQWLFEER